MNNTKQRGKLFTGFLIFTFISSISGLMLNVLGLFVKSTSQGKIAIILCILQLISVILILFWKKIGIYIYFLASFLNLVIAYKYSLHSNTIIISTISTIIMCSILFALTRPAWKQLT
jgi:hypothetical protein